MNTRRKILFSSIGLVFAILATAMLFRFFADRGKASSEFGISSDELAQLESQIQDAKVALHSARKIGMSDHTTLDEKTELLNQERFRLTLETDETSLRAVVLSSPSDGVARLIAASRLGELGYETTLLDIYNSNTDDSEMRTIALHGLIATKKESSLRFISQEFSHLSPEDADTIATDIAFEIILVKEDKNSRLACLSEPLLGKVKTQLNAYEEYRRNNK